jgi:hypothetical protein
MIKVKKMEREGHKNDMWFGETIGIECFIETGSLKFESNYISFHTKTYFKHNTTYFSI